MGRDARSWELKFRFFLQLLSLLNEERNIQVQSKRRTCMACRSNLMHGWMHMHAWRLRRFWRRAGSTARRHGMHGPCNMHAATVDAASHNDSFAAPSLSLSGTYVSVGYTELSRLGRVVPGHTYTYLYHCPSITRQDCLLNHYFPEDDHPITEA